MPTTSSESWSAAELTQQMIFEIKLIAPTNRSTSASDDSAVDDLVTLTIEGSQRLEDAGYGFFVSGFGDKDWPVDVRYDLSTILEQLPDVMPALRSSEESVLQFPGQGIDRALDLMPTGTEVTIRCRSATSWRPDPAIERIGRRELESLFSDLASDFVDALQVLRPTLAATGPAQDLLSLAKNQ